MAWPSTRWTLRGFLLELWHITTSSLIPYLIRYRFSEFQHHVTTDGSEPLDPKVAGYQPYVVHSPHEEFPMALVNRRPYGKPVNNDTFNPQDVAWLAGVKYAEKKVFMYVLLTYSSHYPNSRADLIQRK